MKRVGASTSWQPESCAPSLVPAGGALDRRMRLLVVIDGIVGGLANRSVLVLGAEASEFTILLLDRGARVTAVTSSSGEAASLRARASPRLAVVQGGVGGGAMPNDVQLSHFDLALWIGADAPSLSAVLSYLAGVSRELFVSVAASREEVHPSGIWTKLDAAFAAAGLGWVAIQAPSLKFHVQNELSGQGLDLRQQLLVYAKPKQVALVAR